MTWFRDISFLELLFAGVFIVLYLLYIFRIRRLAAFFNRKGRLVWIKFFVRTAYVIFLLVALLGPSFGGTKKEIKSIGKDIFLAIDLSRSMNATDLQPNRLQRVILEMSNMAGTLNSDRIGLIIFSSDAFVQCPLTHDHAALQLFLQSLSTSLMAEGGTDIGSAIELATKKLTGIKNQKAGEYTRALVLVTDGEDFGDDTERLALQLARKNISLFVVGTGTEEGGKIPAGKGFLRDADGEEVETQLNQEQLRNIARKASGNYFELSDVRNEIPRLTKSLNNLQGQLRATKTIDITDNKYMYPLLAALLLIAFDILITLTIIKV